MIIIACMGWSKCCYVFSPSVNILLLMMGYDSGLTLLLSYCFHLSQLILLILIENLLKLWNLLWFLMTTVQNFIDFYLDVSMNIWNGEKSQISLHEKIVLSALGSGNFLIMQASPHLMLQVFRPIFFITLYHYLIQKDCWNQNLLE